MFKFLKYFLAILLIALGLTFVFEDSIKNSLVSHKQQEISIENVSAKKIKENSKQEAEYDYSKVRVISAEDVLKSTVKGVELNPIGGIAIPGVGINLPILKGTTNDNLLFGAATMKEQEMGKGNYTLASHHVFSGADSDKLLFSPLVNAKEGMSIYLTDKTNIYEYLVYSVEVVSPTRLDLVEDVEGESIVTLITCTDAQATQRTVVRGRLSKVEAWGTSKSRSYFEGNKNNEN